MPKDAVNACENPIRDGVLENLGLPVDVLPFHFQNPHEESFQDPVLTQNRMRLSTAP